MSTKAKVSNDYLHDLRIAHGHKEFRARQNVFITGDGQRDSIGERIRRTVLSFGHQAHSFRGDIRDEKNWHEQDAELKETDTLIMCHGVTFLQWFEKVQFKKVQEIMDVNLTATFGLAQYFVQATIERQWRKRIIMIGSMAHRSVLNGSAAYCASKAGLAMLGRCMAWELAPKGYDVYIIHPSNTYGTPMTEETIQGLMRYRGLDREQATAYWNDTAIRNRMLHPKDISELVMFLMGPHGQYLAGSQIELAGGQR